MKRVICNVLILALTAASFLAPAVPISDGASAVWATDEHDDVMKAFRRGEIMTLARIKQIAQSKLKAVAISQRLRRTNRGWQYYLRLRQENGKVISAILDAKTGEILEVSKAK